MLQWRLATKKCNACYVHVAGYYAGGIPLNWFCCQSSSLHICVSIHYAHLLTILNIIGFWVGGSKRSRAEFVGLFVRSMDTILFYM